MPLCPECKAEAETHSRRGDECDECSRCMSPGGAGTLVAEGDPDGPGVLDGDVYQLPDGHLYEMGTRHGCNHPHCPASEPPDQFMPPIGDAADTGPDVVVEAVVVFVVLSILVGAALIVL